METGLEPLLAEGVITEVLARLQSGKEAEVYVVRFGGKIVAAKVYKDRATRSFKNNATYKEGRGSRNTRSQRAMEKGSRFGKAAAEDAWKSAEADAAYKLHAAQVRVPEPVIFLDGVLLMELVMDENGNAARRIIDTDLTPAQANAAYHDMLVQLVRILCCDLIHGDLSPYNVLWGYAGPVIIDFPQVISAAHNSMSERFFMRDADNILGHYARIDPSLMARQGDAREIWRAYVRRELTPDFLPTGRVMAPSPRVFAPRQELQHHSTLPNMVPRGDGPRPPPARVNVGRPPPGQHREPLQPHQPPPPQHREPAPQHAHREPRAQVAQNPQQPQQQAPRERRPAQGQGQGQQGHRAPQGQGHAPPRDTRRPTHAPEVIVRHPRAGGVQPSPGSASQPPPNAVRADFAPRRPPAPPPSQAPRTAPSGGGPRGPTAHAPSGGAPRDDGSGENEARPAHRRRRRR